MEFQDPGLVAHSPSYCGHCGVNQCIKDPFHVFSLPFNKNLKLRLLKIDLSGDNKGYIKIINRL